MEGERKAATVADRFLAADEARDRNEPILAEQRYRALIAETAGELRIEARFRLAVMLDARGKQTEAAGTGAGMNRMRVAASSRDAALRAAYRKLQESLSAPATAAEEHAAELAQGPEAAIGDDVLAWSKAKPTTPMRMRATT